MLNTPVKSDFEFGVPLSRQKQVKVNPTDSCSHDEFDEFANPAAAVSENLVNFHSLLP